MGTTSSSSFEPVNNTGNVRVRGVELFFLVSRHWDRRPRTYHLDLKNFPIFRQLEARHTLRYRLSFRSQAQNRHLHL
ncbi:UNVERIFIED_CONTAM: hypothetical protein NCL1_35752 [Trichonephila clavipes]